MKLSNEVWETHFSRLMLSMELAIPCPQVECYAPTGFTFVSPPPHGCSFFIQVIEGDVNRGRGETLKSPPWWWQSLHSVHFSISVWPCPPRWEDPFLPAWFCDCKVWLIQGYHQVESNYRISRGKTNIVSKSNINTIWRNVNRVITRTDVWGLDMLPS